MSIRSMAAQLLNRIGIAFFEWGYRLDTPPPGPPNALEDFYAGGWIDVVKPPDGLTQ